MTIEIEQEFERYCELGSKYESESYQKSLEAFEHALSIAKETERNDWLADAHAGKARALWKLTHFPESQQHFKVALDNYLAVGKFYGVAQCYCGLGIISGEIGEYASALDYFDQALNNSRKANSDSFSAVLTGNIGMVYYHLGQYQDAQDCFQKALEQVDRIGRDDLAGQMNAGLAAVLVCREEYAEACHRERNVAYGVASAMHNKGIVLRKMGRSREAEKQLLKTLDYTDKIALRHMWYEAHGELSQVYTDLDELEKAEHHLNLHMQGSKDMKREAVRRQTSQL